MRNRPKKSSHLTNNRKLQRDEEMWNFEDSFFFRHISLNLDGTNGKEIMPE